MRDQAFPVPQPVVLGHEGAGIVVDIGTAVTSVRVGDAVLMSYHSCGSCPSCLANLPGFCHDFFGHNFASARSDDSTALSQQGKSVHAHFFGQSSFDTSGTTDQRTVRPPSEAGVAEFTDLQWLTISTLPPHYPF